MTGEYEATCYHEAAHAVAAIYQRVPFESVSCEPQGTSLGRLVLGTLNSIDDATLDELVSRAVVGLAGSIAESWYKGNEIEIDPEGADRDEMVDFLISREPDEKARQALADYIWQKTMIVVHSHWADIEKVAMALQEESALARGEITKLLFGV